MSGLMHFVLFKARTETMTGKGNQVECDSSTEVLMLTLPLPLQPMSMGAVFLNQQISSVVFLLEAQRASFAEF